MPVSAGSSGVARKAAKRLPSCATSTRSSYETAAPEMTGIGGEESRSKHTAETESRVRRVREALLDWHAGGGRPARLVRRARPRAAVAGDARPVRDPRLRGDAAADSGRSGRAALGRLARALADRNGAGRGVDR